MSSQAEEVAFTEEDLELIRERETNIRQLEVEPHTMETVHVFTFTLIHEKIA